MSRICLVLALLAATGSGCTTPDEASPSAESTPAEAGWPEPVVTEADSVAAQVLEAVGGADAWRALPYLRFDFAVRSDGGESFRRHHLWDRMSGDYRLEQDGGADSTYVMLFNTETRTGKAYLNGEPVADAESETRVESAYASFINDMYWLLMPAKLLDPGVNRSLDPDSSNADTAVLRLTFGEVGLTPKDTYWIWVDRASGLVTDWAYVLQGRPDAPPTRWTWTNWVSHDSPVGPVMMADTKVGRTRSILTDALSTPAGVETGAFTDPAPRMD